MTVPPPPPGSGLDPMPRTHPTAPVGDVPPGPGPSDVPGRPAPGGPGTGRLALVATGRDDGRRHVVDVVAGEAGDPAGLRGRCGAPVVAVVPGLGAVAADCPSCLLTVGTGGPDPVAPAPVAPGPVAPGPVAPGPGPGPLSGPIL